ncbi:SNF2 family N-terminal domain-containing protein [Aspergillus pseudonomiae]|uniref:SNF2 family N-terminal domain-containing protein n=1 Tax=Aspergillus pseudonomiae TaxID=1506151 RepID=A0A5N6HNI0_9EURO|nr:SNF2 family N-terminal domain-containing protein [Aspergillus pseudonomiae]KAB8255818.1 SNF2 family N-terminal domain-containing protein [Aspergillus pseudonomiae]KAE8401572.1 SNF2 family N-terminal domain-containing protein [Aspergillus pseudonomiae]
MVSSSVGPAWLSLPSFSWSSYMRWPTGSWKTSSKSNSNSDNSQSSMDDQNLQDARSDSSSSPPTPWSSPLGSLSSTTLSPMTSSLPFHEPESKVHTDGIRSHSTVSREGYCVAKSAVDIMQGIESKRNNFFTAIKDIVLPLLGDKGQFYQNKETWTATVRPYKPLNPQPTGLQAQLKPYQLRGLSFLLYLRNNGIGGILADEMGLGKTIQTLALFQCIKRHDNTVRLEKPGPFLIVCPFSVMEVWLSEINKWTPELTSIKFHGTPSKKEAVKKILTPARGKSRRSLTPAVDIVITSYETLTSDIKWFRKFVWNYVVLDEGHRIKNNQSHRAQTIQSIRAEYKLVLSGTPIQNNLRELWSIFHWLYPDVFVPSTSEPFEEAFSLRDGKFDPKFFDQVQSFLGLIMLRRVKESPEVGLSIPQKTDTVLSVPLSEFQQNSIQGGYGSISFGHKREMSKHQKSNMMCEQNDGFNAGTSGLSSAKHVEKRKYRILSNILMELRKCSIHPYLLDDAIPDPYELGAHVITNSGKYIVLLKMVQHFVLKRGKKIVIFSNFNQALNLCEDLLLTIQRNGDPVRYVRLDGSTSNARRNLSIYLFQKDPRYMVFLISIRAGGEGLNLISSSTVIFLDEDWNPQVMRQAEARVHRMGQNHPVSIFKLQSKGTVEEQISRRIVKKAYVASKVMEDMTAAHDMKAFANMIDSRGLAYAMDTEDLSALVRSRAVLTSNQLDATELSWFNWKSILNLCVSNQSIELNGKNTAIDVHQEKAWLARSERVKTNIFDGKKVDTRFRSFSIYEALPTDLCRADRRIGKERTVIIDGFSVGKDSIRLESLSSKRCPNLSQTDLKEKMTHEAACFLCRKFNPQECDLCPLAFHKECLESIGKMRRRWALVLLYNLL